MKGSIYLQFKRGFPFGSVSVMTWLFLEVLKTLFLARASSVAKASVSFKKLGELTSSS